MQGPHVSIAVLGRSVIVIDRFWNAMNDRFGVGGLILGEDDLTFEKSIPKSVGNMKNWEKSFSESEVTAKDNEEFYI